MRISQSKELSPKLLRITFGSNCVFSEKQCKNSYFTFFSPETVVIATCYLADTDLDCEFEIAPTKCHNPPFNIAFNFAVVHSVHYKSQTVG